MPRPAALEHPKCPACGRPARPGIRCVATYCVWELKVNKQGYVVLSRPLRQGIK